MTTLGSALGHLADPPREAPYEALRLDLLDRVVQVAAADGTAWVTAWDATSRALADAVLAEARDAIQAAARYARFPSRRVAALLPDAETADALLQRLRAAGIPLETLAARATTPDVTRERAAAMEGAWHEARQIALGDLARWRAIAGEIAAWRRPLRGVLLASAVAVVIVAILAAWLGGWLPAPGWFAPLGTWFWSLPWP